MFRALIERASRRLPARCAICHAWPSQVVCNACVARFAQPVPRCATCALPVPANVHQCGACLKEPPPLGARATVMRSTPWVEPALEQADRVLPMPLARERLAERGFNQALLLAQHLAPRRTDARLLLRTRHTPAQSELKRAERLRNVQGVFAVEPLRAHELRDRRVVLVDDVMTSGASLHAASLALRQAGAAHITALVFARTEVV